MKLCMWTGGNTLIMQSFFFCRRMKIVVALVMEIVKMLQKHMDPKIIGLPTICPSFRLSVSVCWNLDLEITQKLYKLAGWNLVCEHENLGCYGNGNSQYVAKTYGSWDNSITFQASLMEK